MRCVFRWKHAGYILGLSSDGSSLARADRSAARECARSPTHAVMRLRFLLCMSMTAQRSASAPTKRFNSGTRHSPSTNAPPSCASLHVHTTTLHHPSPSSSHLPSCSSFHESPPPVSFFITLPGRPPEDDVPPQGGGGTCGTHWHCRGCVPVLHVFCCFVFCVLAASCVGKYTRLLWYMVEAWRVAV